MPIIQFVVWAVVAEVASLVLQPAAAATAADEGVVGVTDERADPEIQIWQVSCRDLARLADDGDSQSRAVLNGP